MAEPLWGPGEAWPVWEELLVTQVGCKFLLLIRTSPPAPSLTPLLLIILNSLCFYGLHILQVRLPSQHCKVENQKGWDCWQEQLGPEFRSVGSSLGCLLVSLFRTFSWTSAGHSILEFLGEEVRICILRKVSQVIESTALGSLTVIYKSQTEKKAWKKKMGQCVFLKFSEHLLYANCSSLTVSLHRTEQSTRGGMYNLIRQKLFTFA